MSPTLLSDGEVEGQSNVTLLASLASIESVAFKERNYMRLSGCSSEDSAVVSNIPDENKRSLNLKATELRLGLPGSQSPVRDAEPGLSSTQLDEKTFFTLYPFSDGNYTSSQKAFASSGNKRGFEDAMDGFSEGKFVANSKINIMLSPRPSPNIGLKTSSAPDILGTQLAKAKDVAPAKMVKERSLTVNETRNHNDSAYNNSSAPAPIARVVGWPPIRSFRKNSLASTSKNTDEVDGKSGRGILFVKVSMDGAPYLRKVDLKNYSAYQELSSSLEKMFSCFTIGQYGSHGAPGKEMISESKLQDMLHGSEYVLTYEDKDGDWMLVGDVPWKMFINTCKRLRIMKSSDAIGLAPRAMEKCRNRN